MRTFSVLAPASSMLALECQWPLTSIAAEWKSQRQTHQHANENIHTISGFYAGPFSDGLEFIKLVPKVLQCFWCMVCMKPVPVGAFIVLWTSPPTIEYSMSSCHLSINLNLNHSHPHPHLPRTWNQHARSRGNSINCKRPSLMHTYLRTSPSMTKRRAQKRPGFFRLCFRYMSRNSTLMHPMAFNLHLLKWYIVFHTFLQ